MAIDTTKQLLWSVIALFIGISITDIVLPVASQSMIISAIVPDLTGCTVAKFRAEVMAPQPGFVFLWALDNGTASAVLANIVLDPDNNVVGINNTAASNPFIGQYFISNEPMNLESFDTPFNSTLTFLDLGPNDKLNFSIYVRGVAAAYSVVSQPECAISPANCRNCSVMQSIPCGTSIGKFCHNGTILLDVCPVNTQSYEDAACSLVQCPTSFLGNLSAEVDPSRAVVDFSDTVTAQCQPGFNGDDVVYVCTSEEVLLPENDTTQIKCSPDINEEVIIACSVVGGLLILLGNNLLVFFCSSDKASTTVRNVALLVVGAGLIVIGVGLILGLPDNATALGFWIILIVGGAITSLIAILYFVGCIGDEKALKKSLKLYS